MDERRTYPTIPVAEKLRNLRDFLPGQSQFLYSFASHVADRLTPSHVKPHNVYGNCFPGAALASIAEMRFLPAGQDHATIYGYSFSRKLLGHPVSSYTRLFDQLPEIFTAITDGQLRTDILQEIDRTERTTPKRLDSYDPSVGKFVPERSNSIDQKRTKYRSSRDGREFNADQIQYVCFPSCLRGGVAELNEVPQLLFAFDTATRYSRVEPEFFVPLERTKGFVPMVAWVLAVKA